jgi:pimeloyl-ACP methyl ester carboxylesterase
MSHTVYQSADVDGVSVFYREAGPPDRPTILLLHGFPSSSRMWEPLLTRLADVFHLIAPDYPGFGHSDAPARAGFAYTFDHLAEIIGRFTEQLGLGRYTLFMQDYGGPVGFRLATAHPARVRAMIVQNAVAHSDGLVPLWDTRRAFWADRAAHEAELRENFFSPAATRLRHVGRSPVPQEYDPDLWTDELAFLGQPGQHDIQTDLFFDYRTNVASYPAWQEWLRANRPPLLVAWGRYDPSFEAAEAEAYRRDVPDAEVHLLDAGHFALDEQPDLIAELTRRFLLLRGRTPTRSGRSPAWSSGAAAAASPRSRRRRGRARRPSDRSRRARAAGSRCPPAPA